MNSSNLTILADQLDQLLIRVGEACPVTISYHPDADTGDGRGWSVEIGDRHTYGTAEEALGKALEVPRG